MKKLLMLFTMLFGSLPHSYSQTWQWGKSGGTSIDALGYGPFEDIEDITTDKWGNIYFIANVYNDVVYIDTAVYTSFGWPFSAQICLVSVRCDGTFRWYKMVIGSSNNEAISIKTDTLGGVYITGRMVIDAGAGGGGPTSGYIRNGTTVDTTIAPLPYPLFKTMFLLKLDTGGAYKWFMMPEPDTATIFGGSYGSYDMDVDEAGNSFTLCLLRPGAYAGGAFIATDTAGWDISGENVYVLKFNSSGIFQSGVHLPFKFIGHGGPTFYMKHDNTRHRLYITGNTGTIAGDSLFIAGTLINDMFLACFDESGHLLWYKHDNPIAGHSGSPGSDPVLDNDGNIYIVGGCTSGFTFNGSAFVNLLGGATSFLVKLDTNGTNIWAVNASNNDVSSGMGVAVVADTVAVFGYYACSQFIWGTDTLREVINEGYRIFLARINATTGAEIALDSLAADFGSNNMPGNGGGFTTGTLAADRYGNFYGGGNFSSRLYVPGDTLVSTGGETDWFIAKFGTSNCSTLFAPSLTVENNHPVTNGFVKVYPNPVTEELFIENAIPNTVIRLCNIVGQEVFSGIIQNDKQAISTANLSPGVYILRLTDIYGNRANKTIVKQ